MRRWIADRFTYANVVSTLCLFVLLGGGAYAATKLSKDSVGSKQVKNGSIRGVDVDESSLGTVPGASRAVTARNAEQIDGIEASEFVRSFGGHIADSSSGPIFYVQELDAVLLGDGGPAGTSCFRIRHVGDFGDIHVSSLDPGAGPLFTVPSLHTSAAHCDAGPLVLTNTVHPDLMLVFGCAEATSTYCYGQLIEAPTPAA